MSEQQITAASSDPLALCRRRGRPGYCHCDSRRSRRNGLCHMVGAEHRRRSLDRQTQLAQHVIGTQSRTCRMSRRASPFGTTLSVHPSSTLRCAIDINLGVWMHDFFGHDEAIILNDHNEPIYAMNNGARVSRLRRCCARNAGMMPLVMRCARRSPPGPLDSLRGRNG